MCSQNITSLFIRIIPKKTGHKGPVNFGPEQAQRGNYFWGLEITTSTRRLRWRPSAVSLLATGLASPKPWVVMRAYIIVSHQRPPRM
jgi:hypothetical protein